MSTATITLLPPVRLGALLRERREAQGRSIDDVAAGCRLGPAELVALEAGEVVLAEGQVDDVLAAYATRPDELVPRRSQVVIDLDRGELVVAEESALVGSGAPTPDEILAAYLSLLYTLRRVDPGTPLVLRQYDVSVLARALRLAEPEVESRLLGLMASPSPELGRFHRLLRKKLVVPVAGAVVVAGVLGTVLVVGRGGDGGSAPPSTAGGGRPPAVEVPVEADVSLLPPVQQQRNPDGTPGAPVEVAPEAPPTGAGAATATR